jgi:hypothetical protein
MAGKSGDSNKKALIGVGVIAVIIVSILVIIGATNSESFQEGFEEGFNAGTEEVVQQVDGVEPTEQQFAIQERYFELLQSPEFRAEMTELFDATSTLITEEMIEEKFAELGLDRDGVSLELRFEEFAEITITEMIHEYAMRLTTEEFGVTETEVFAANTAVASYRRSN